MTVTDTEAAHDLLERTREIVPALRSRVDQTASMRRVPDENVADLRRAGSLKTLQSTRNQGYGLSMRAHLDTVATLARGCASTAWCAGVVHAHSWLLSHFPVEAQDEVYGGDPRLLRRRRDRHPAARPRRPPTGTCCRGSGPSPRATGSPTGCCSALPWSTPTAQRSTRATSWSPRPTSPAMTTGT